MKLRIALEEKEMDVRLRDRLVAEGKLSKQEVDKYLNSLGDDDGKFERISGLRVADADEE
jgi:hypothetical protein